MMYLVYCSHSYSTSNQLEAKVLELMWSFNRDLITPNQLEDYKKEVVDYIEKLNKAYPLCRPVKIKFEKCRSLNNDSKDFRISWNSFMDSNRKKLCEFAILASKEVTP